MKSEIHGKILSFRPKREDIHSTIRSLAAADQKLYFGAHARERMVERGITRLDAVRVLQTGHINGDIVAGNNAGEWKCKVTGNVKGSREIGVVTIVCDGSSLFIKTVEWEDL